MVIRVAAGVALRLSQPRPGGLIHAQLENTEAPAGQKIHATRTLNGRELATALFEAEIVTDVHHRITERDLRGSRN